LHLIGRVGIYNRIAVISKANNVSRINCYYLDGIEAITPESDVIKFYKILEGLELSENEEVMTTAKVVMELNNYIRLKGVIKEDDTEVDTKGWCKWVESEEHLPILDFDYEWDPTAGEDGTGAFVKVN
jgi:hypothetical protein